MGKFSTGSQISNLQERSLPQLPTTPVEEAQVQTAPTGEPPAQPSSSAGWLAQLAAAQAEAEQVAPEAAAAAQPELQAIQQEEARQSIPSLAQRGQDTGRVDRWLRPVTSQVSQQPDGGIRGRASTMARNVQSGGIAPSLSARGYSADITAADKAGVRGPALAEAIAQEKEGTVMGAISRANAVVPDAAGRPTVAPEYVQVASAVVENDLANGFFGGDTDLNKPQEEAAEPGVVTAIAGSAGVGQKIHQEFQRMQGVSVPEKLPPKEAETLGAVFKDMWAMNNPDYVTRSPNPETGVHEYQLTAAGEQALRLGEEDRKRLFPKTQVRPAKTPLPKGVLPGDVGANVARREAGTKVGKAKYGKTIEDAMVNMAQIPNVVDKQRAKILYSTILPVLASGDYSSWMAEINNMGPSKLQSYEAAGIKKTETGEVASPQEFVESTMAALTDKIAQEVRAIAQERNGANYLTYSVMGFNGRITPQQSFFNPTTSKAVRFVTRNAVPAIAKPGSKTEYNLRQMYAMMLVGGSDVALPQERERMLNSKSGQLESWGDQLSQALTMTDEQYEAVSEAISQGLSLDDPNFPQIQPLQVEDPQLQQLIQSKGEDGPHFIDGLIDFAKYQKAKRAGRPHHSYFNAYIDGKTNGLASNGMQMGHAGTALATGTIRESRTQLLDNGDPRDQMRDTAVKLLDAGWDGNVDGFESELNHVAQTLFTNKPIGRNLLKAMTMTFGYGKEISSFVPNVEASIGELALADPDFATSLATVDKSIPRTELAQTILNQKLDPAMRTVLSDEAMESRSLMRAAAALHAAANQLFSIKGPTGMDINLGRDVALPYEMAEQTKYKIGDQTRTVAHRETETTAAAAKSRVDEDGNVEFTPGEVAYGGAVVAPVQAIDAGTVAATASGRSWQRLKGRGNPYLHTIYDAFKMDANGYDIILEEVNKNWLDQSLNWSYLKSTYDSTMEAMKNFQQKIGKRNPNETLTANERAYMDWFLQMQNGPYGRNMGNLRRKLPKFKDMSSTEINKAEQMFRKGMKSVGYDVDNPPENPTVRQLKQFTQLLAGELNLRSRMNSMINHTDKKKSELRSRIQKEAYRTPSGERISLQYYAH